MSKLIFLDTNILQSLANNKFKESANSLLSFVSQLDENYKFNVMFFQKYEFLRGINAKGKWKKFSRIIERFNLVEPDMGIFEFIRILYLVYKEELKKKADEGDLILATANMLSLDSYILTTNAKDFPPPFFNVHEKFEIQDKHSNYNNTAVLLEIDRETTVKTYQKLFK